MRQRFADAGLPSGSIRVSMLDSVVFLTGSVPSRMAKYHAENLAAQIPGVTDVENLLQVVSRKSRPHDPRA